MNLEQRRKLLETLMELSEQYPDWRLGQMITNLATRIAQQCPAQWSP